jgi:hypothetical protein
MKTLSRTLIFGLALALLVAAPAAAGTLRKPAPRWFTPALEAQLQLAGADGVQVAAEYLNLDCPGYQSRGVGAAGCIVAPYGCTANFVFTDGTSYYVGTARHCVDAVGQTVTMQVDTTTLADVGTVAKHTSGDGQPGNDFALIRLDPAVVTKWGVNPAIPVIGGPNGVYAGCGPEAVRHYGHGYGVAVAQGKPEGGVATSWFDDGYGWTGFGAPGDSGSPVVTSDGRGAGDFTHLIVDTRYPGSDLAGMRLTAILRFAGVALMNADGTTTSGPTTTSCGGTAAKAARKGRGRKPATSAAG